MKYINFKEEIKKENSIILDVRTPEEYNSGHIPNSINIDFYSYSFLNNIKKLDITKTYYVYCVSGHRSHEALEVMELIGFANIYDLDGGISMWKGELE